MQLSSSDFGANYIGTAGEIQTGVSPGKAIGVPASMRVCQGVRPCCRVKYWAMTPRLLMRKWPAIEVQMEPVL